MRSILSGNRRAFKAKESALSPPLPSMPGTVKFLMVLIAALGLWSGTRFGAAIRFWSVWQEYALRGGPLYLALSGAFWLAGTLTVLVGIWTCQRWAWQATVSLWSGYFIWYWLDRLCMQSPHANGPWALFASLLLLALALGATFHPATRGFFREGAP